MRKAVVVMIVVLLVSATGAFAARGGGFAIGGEGALYFAGNGGLPSSAMLTVHLPGFPLMLGLGFSSASAFGLTADYWFEHGNLASVLDYYVGIGGYLSLNSSGDGTVGARVPIGIQLWPVGQVLEIFAEVAPALGIYIVPTGFEWHLQGAVGFRFWF
jgi:hypothetical protein